MADITRLRTLIRYVSHTGNFYWVLGGGKGKEGKLAGTRNRRGYIRIQVGGRKYLAHRLAWLMTYAELPINQIDHINNNPSDNRILNLRLATHAENGWNRSKQSNNTSGHKGGYLASKEI